MDDSRRYALTYPQLVLQAVARGYDDAALARLKRGHEAAMRVVDGRYRAQDVPFLCHLVRTASIAMEHGASKDVVLASLLHAVYSYGARRRAIADAIGSPAEELVFAYHRAANRASRFSVDGDVRFIALANELEDFLDQQMGFRAGDRSHETVAGKGALQDELDRAFRRTLDEPVPVVAKTARTSSYRLSSPWFLDPNNRLRAWLWRFLKR